SNNIIYGAFFGKGEWNKDKLCSILDEYNAVNPNDVEENWFSINYGGKYFSNDIAKMIGYVRQDIENKKPFLTEKEYDILLSSLIYCIDRLANTVGHFDAYIKKIIKPQEFFLRLVNARSLDNVEIHQEDANKLAKTVKADVVYLDPPYNSRQYCRFYHVYETLVKWDKPKLYGVALKPKPENMSLYCTSRAVKAFEDLIYSLDAKMIVVSYNNTYNSKSKSSKNKIRLSQIKQILDSCGTTTIYEHQHQFFNAGKTCFEDHKEFLFVTKIDENKRNKSLTSLLRWG
ncbi:MAG: DNA adenine methylase, partial [Prevotella sp.]|nr:DNA adenine methylase [Prevotella sp.]